MAAWAPFHYDISPPPPNCLGMDRVPVAAMVEGFLRPRGDSKGPEQKPSVPGFPFSEEVPAVVGPPPPTSRVRPEAGPRATSVCVVLAAGG